MDKKPNPKAQDDKNLSADQLDKVNGGRPIGPIRPFVEHDQEEDRRRREIDEARLRPPKY